MATKQYQWRASTTFQNLPDPDYLLTHGVDPATQENWQTSDIGGSQSGSWRFWYRDSNTSYGGQWVDTISSRLNIQVSESWSTSVDSRNNLTITYTVTVGPIYRDDSRGGGANTPGRTINIYQQQGGAVIISLTDMQIATDHTLQSGTTVFGPYTITLAPGEELQTSSLFVHNQTIGYQSYDDIWMGVQFKNILPKETVPHAVLGSSGQWLSHNREGGDLRVYNNGRWSNNLANTGGGEDYGDPPSVMKNNKWLNARTFGLDS